MWDGVPSRHHEQTCAAHDSGTMAEQISTALAATVLPDWCTTVPRVAAVGMSAATLLPVAMGDSPPTRNDLVQCLSAVLFMALKRASTIVSC